MCHLSLPCILCSMPPSGTIGPHQGQANLSSHESALFACDRVPVLTRQRLRPGVVAPYHHIIRRKLYMRLFRWGEEHKRITQRQQGHNCPLARAPGWESKSPVRLCLPSTFLTFGAFVDNPGLSTNHGGESSLTLWSVERGNKSRTKKLPHTA